MEYLKSNGLENENSQGRFEGTWSLGFSLKSGILIVQKGGKIEGLVVSCARCRDLILLGLKGNCRIPAPV
jgi:hypothetical protein